MSGDIAKRWAEINQHVDAYYLSQIGCYFSSVSFEPDRIVAKSKIENTPIWNHVFFRQSELFKIQSALTPDATASGAVYVWPNETIEAQISLRGYEFVDEEIWMRLEGLAAFKSSQKSNGTQQQLCIKEVGDELIPSFCAPLNHAFGDGYSDCVQYEYKATGNVQRHFRHYVVLLNDKLVCGASTYQYGDVIFIHNMYTVVEARRRGYARWTLEQLLNVETSRQKLFLLQVEGRSPARSLYETFGFSVYFRRHGYAPPSSVVPSGTDAGGG